LHKDYLDGIILEKDGKEYRRVPEVLDCWFESGSMTFAQFHYPFENKEFFENNFPAQFVAEYIAQVRTWFYYMNVLSAIIFDDIPFENIVTTGNILSDDGQKMSKSKKNFTDPLILIEKYGVDALRLYLASCPVMNAQDINFSDKQIEEIYKKVMVLLYNVNNFYKLYDKIEDENLNSENIMDKWIISRLNEVLKNMNLYLKNYNTLKAGSEIKGFIEDLSTWYVRQTRERFNEGDRQAKATLRHVLENFSKIIAPIMPFIAENIYQSLNGKDKSVHLEDWINCEENKIDSLLNEEMVKLRKIVSEGLKVRDQKGIGLKWPLAKAVVKFKGSLGEEFVRVLKDELNIKEVEFEENDILSVELDLNLTPELEAEGYAREFARKIQAARKKEGLQKGEMVKMKVSCNQDLMIILEKNIDFIKDRTNASEINFLDEKNNSFDCEEVIKDKKFTFSFNQ
jgi:isoleucyl-tRNA synthetase